MLEISWIQRAILGVTAKLPDSKKIGWETQAGKLAFKYLRAAYHLAVIRKCYESATTDHSARMMPVAKLENDHSSYEGTHAQVLFFHLDAFFEAARAAHDFILTCLRSAEVLPSGPSSLHDYSSKPVSVRAPAIDQQLRNFWVACGEKTKAYRDCFGHYVSLSGLVWQTALNTRWRNGSWELKLFLPDNPESRSYAAFSFDKGIDALELCEEVLAMTGNLLGHVFKACLRKWQAELGEPSFTIRNIVLGR